jgi:hypothetical protein
MRMMTPQEIADYKRKWMMTGDNNPVRLHSDLDWRGKDWCRKHLERQSWSMTTWTDVYEHTFFFETEDMSQQFTMAMPQEFVNQ